MARMPEWLDLVVSWLLVGAGGIAGCWMGVALADRRIEREQSRRSDAA